MTFLLLLAVLLLVVVALLLYRIDDKLQSIGDMMHEASKSEEPRRLDS